MEVVRAGNPHCLRGGVFCGEVEAVRAGNPHLLKSWGGGVLWSLKAVEGGGGVFCGEVEVVHVLNSKAAGGGVLWRRWQPALA